MVTLSGNCSFFYLRGWEIISAVLGVAILSRKPSLLPHFLLFLFEDGYWYLRQDKLMEDQKKKLFLSQNQTEKTEAALKVQGRYSEMFSGLPSNGALPFYLSNGAVDMAAWGWHLEDHRRWHLWLQGCLWMPTSFLSPPKRLQYFPSFVLGVPVSAPWGPSLLPTKKTLRFWRKWFHLASFGGS